MANFRAVGTAVLAEATSYTQRVYELLELTVYDTDISADYTSYITNAPFNITIGGNTYIALGGMLGFSEIEENSDFTITQVTVSLQGLQSQDVSLFLRANYTDRPLKIYRVWLDTAQQTVGSPLLIFDGRIDRPIINDDGRSCTVGCTASSHWADYDRRAGRHTNFDEQIYWSLRMVNPSTDKGFEFTGNSIKDLKWGSK